MMSGVVEFLKARLDEDERRCMSVPGGHFQVQALDEGNGGGEEEAVQQYYHRFQPEWMLRDIAAKKALITEWRSYGDIQDPYDDEQVTGRALLTAMKLLTAAYSDHPDYRPEWKA